MLSVLVSVKNFRKSWKPSRLFPAGQSCLKLVSHICVNVVRGTSGDRRSGSDASLLVCKINAVLNENECIMANNGRGSSGIAVDYDRPTRPHLSSRPSAEGDWRAVAKSSTRNKKGRAETTKIMILRRERTARLIRISINLINPLARVIILSARVVISLWQLKGW